MNRISLRLLAPVVAVLALLPSAVCAPKQKDPAIEKILPVPADVRKIFDHSCVICHGEVTDGKAEMREDLDLTSDASIRDTLSEAGRLKQMILEDKMPQKPKLSFRLRGDAKLQDRLAKIKADYGKNGEKEKLLAWLADIVATTGEKDD